MSNGYVEPRGARHRIEIVDGVEQVRLPTRRSWFLLAFLPLWLTGWTAGGVFAIWQVITTHELFLILWLCGWAAGWVFAVSTLAAQIWGAETIRASLVELEVTKSAGPFRRQWHYRADLIRNLGSTDPSGDPWGMREMQTPVWTRNRSGAVKFDYGAETIFIAVGVDQPEGRAIARWLALRLPTGATASALASAL